jgi:hypothetical protein
MKSRMREGAVRMGMDWMQAELPGLEALAKVTRSRQ